MRFTILMTLLFGCTVAIPPAKPDVIFITIDTLRVDHVGAFNPKSPAKTPNLDRLARDGVRFTQAWSPISITGPAFASLFTGMTPGQHGVLLNFFRGGAPLEKKHETLAEQLRPTGYRTGAFVSGFTLRKKAGLSQGFNVYDSPTNYRRWGWRTVRLAIDWLSASQKPAFLWYHNYDAHGPLKRWVLPDETTRTWKRAPESSISPHQRLDDIVDPEYYKAKYALAVEFADTQVGSLLEALDKSDRYDNALIVFVADHGEGFDEREVWFDHGTDAYAEQLHIPMVIKLPKNASAGTSVETMVSLIDVLPTVRNVLGMSPKSGLDGGDLRQVEHLHLNGENSHCQPWPYANCAPVGGKGKVLVTRTSTHSLMRRMTPTGAVYERYDRTVDPEERTPTKRTVSLPPETASPIGSTALRGPLDQLVLRRTTAKYAALPKAKAKEESQEIKNLRALGYVE
jgi:hypothetical protein